MSAFFFAMNRDGSNFDHSLAASMMSQLDGFGDDSSELIVKDNFAIAYQARWSVPEENGEQQPLHRDKRHYFVFLGRLDNRTEIIQFLALSDGQSMSDAELVWQYVLRFGASRLNDIIGPYVFVAFDAISNELLVARDPMGGRHLVSHICDELVLLSTYEMALVAHPKIGYKINSEKVAFSLAMQLETRTLACIENLLPLEPGVFIKLESKKTTIERFYRATPKQRRQLPSDQAYAEEFRRLLTQAVVRRMRAVEPVATMMSGGLDSVPIAIAASELELKNEHRHQALSWVFDRFSEADERRYSAPVCTSCSIQQHQINCDTVWPSFDEDTHLNPVYPVSIPYSEFQQATFRRAQKEGIGTILTGIHGDVLYGHTEGIVYEQLRAGNWKSVCSLIGLYWQHTGSKIGLIKNLFLKPSHLIRRLIRWRQRFKDKTSAVLNDDLAANIPFREHPLQRESDKALRPRQWQNLFDGSAGNDMALGRVMEAKYKIDRRYPMRDRDLCEFMASIPSTQLIDGLIARPIVLRAFDKELPTSIKRRNTKTSFQSVINSQIANDEKAKYWLKTSSAWQQYVKHCYFDNPKAELDLRRLVQWRCAYYNFWRHTCYDQIQEELVGR